MTRYYIMAYLIAAAVWFAVNIMDRENMEHVHDIVYNKNTTSFDDSVWKAVVVASFMFVCFVLSFFWPIFILAGISNKTSQ